MKNKKERFLLLALALLLLLSIIIIAGLQEEPRKFFTNNNENLEAEKILEANRLSIASVLREVGPQTEEVKAEELIYGSLEAPVQILVYEDYSDQYSASFNQQLIKVQQVWGEQLSIAVRPYEINNQNSLALSGALAVQCAREAGYLQKFRDKVFLEVLGEVLVEESFLKISKELGIVGFDKCYQNQNNREVLAQKLKFTSQVVFGAPTIILNGEIVTGNRSFEDQGDLEGLDTIIKRQIIKL